MSLLTLPDHKKGYLETVVREYLESLPDQASSTNGQAQREAEYLTHELLDALHLHCAALDVLHESADSISASDWDASERRLTCGLRALLELSKQFLAELPAATPQAERLREQVRTIESETFWSVSDYVGSPKFNRMVRESEGSYAAGEWEEGGWNEFVSNHFKPPRKTQSLATKYP